MTAFSTRAPDTAAPDPLAAIRAAAQAHGCTAALVAHASDIRWATGFTGSNALLCVTPDAAHFLTDGRYTTQAPQEVTNAEIHVPGYDLAGAVAEAGYLADHRTAVQADRLTVATLQTWTERLADVDLVPVDGLLRADVARKSAEAAGKIRAAQRLTESVFERLLPLIQPGMKESDLAAEIVYLHLKGGAEAMSFEPIVASGPRGALPHARASQKTLRPGELVVIDMGGVLDGYCSDMTRTVAVGEPPEEARRGYALVLEAQTAALEAARAGLTSRALDAAARDVIEAAGMGAYFSHSLGHGVGMEVHEWPPVSFRSDDVLPDGAVVSIEPGVYVPERYGVRIEDLVWLHADGAENLTSAPRELLVL